MTGRDRVVLACFALSALTIIVINTLAVRALW